MGVNFTDAQIKRLATNNSVQHYRKTKLRFAKVPHLVEPQKRFQVSVPMVLMAVVTLASLVTAATAVAALLIR